MRHGTRLLRCSHVRASERHSRSTSHFSAFVSRSSPNSRCWSSRSTEPTPRSRFSSVYDPAHGTDWRQWFSAAEYENPWDDRRFSAQWTWNPAADCATKHVLSQLQTVHHFEQHVSTELCNAMLRNLLELIPTSKSLDPDEAAQTVHICERAHAILQTMELLDGRMTTPSLHKRLPRPLPKPNRETYNTVLLICSKTASPNRSIPDVTAAIARRMHDRYHVRQELDMKPVSFHWNCVLLAWMNCDNPEKAVHAVQLLLSLAASSDATSLVDASSYIHVLRICAYHRTTNTSITTSSVNSAKLGATVAVKLWHEMFERPESNATRVHVPDALPSHFYSHFLQAIRPLPMRSSGTGSRVRDTYYAACLQRACDSGKVNHFVLQDFFVHVKSKPVFDHFLGSYRKQIHGLSTDDAVKRLMQLIPPEWTAKAD